MYAASNAGVLHAIDPATGRDRWAFDGGNSDGVTAKLEGQPTTPVVNDGAVYAQDGSGTLTALAEDGQRPRWRVTLGDSSCASAAVGRDGTVYTAADNDPRGCARRTRLVGSESGVLEALYAGCSSGPGRPSR